jgi:hypothetical protein
VHVPDVVNDHHVVHHGIDQVIPELPGLGEPIMLVPQLEATRTLPQIRNRAFQIGAEPFGRTILLRLLPRNDLPDLCQRTVPENDRNVH